MSVREEDKALRKSVRTDTLQRDLFQHFSVLFFPCHANKPFPLLYAPSIHHGQGPKLIPTLFASQITASSANIRRQKSRSQPQETRTYSVHKSWQVSLVRALAVAVAERQCCRQKIKTLHRVDHHCCPRSSRSHLRLASRERPNANSTTHWTTENTTLHQYLHPPPVSCRPRLLRV